MPLGFTNYEDTRAASGLITEEGKLFLAVWNLGSTEPLTLDLGRKIKSVKVGYPANLPTDFDFSGNSLTVRFNRDFMARFFEIELD